MKKSIERFLINTQLWVSFMISLLCLFFGSLNHSVNYNRIAIIFFSALAAYNFICFQNTWSRNILKKLSFHISFISLILVAFIVCKEKDLLQFFHIAFIGSIVIMYNSDFIKIPFRNISLLKIFIISFAWAYAILYIGNSGNRNTFAEFLILYFFIIGITLPFDICDMKKDVICTIPNYLGIRKSKGIACICLFLSALVFALTFYKQGDLIYVTAWEVVCIISMGMVVFMGKTHQFFYTRFWMEACSALPIIIIWLQKIRVVLFYKTTLALIKSCYEF